MRGTSVTRFLWSAFGASVPVVKGKWQIALAVDNRIATGYEPVSTGVGSQLA